MGTLVICGRISVEFRFLCREACRFKSCHPHQNPGTKVPGFFADGDLESWDSRSPLPLRSVPGRRPPDVWHPVIRIISFKPFIYKGLELFLFWICLRSRVENNDLTSTLTSTGMKAGTEDI